MKKFLGVILSIAFAGAAYAANIPSSVDPKEGPEVWLTSVYNNSGAVLDAGDVVIWDTGSATGDNDNYVTRTTTAATHSVAGVVYPAPIGIGASGSIALWGNGIPVDVTAAVSDGSALCTSTTAGAAGVCTSSQLGQMIGFCVAQQASGECVAKVNIK